MTSPFLPSSTSSTSLTFADLLRQHRVAAGLTQEELASRAGISVDAISTLERGTRRAPRKDTVELLVEALALAPEERAAFALAARRPPSDALAATPREKPGPGHDAPSPAGGDLPRGNVTFLFAEIEGVTRLLNQIGTDAYAEVLAELQDLLRPIWVEHTGHELGAQEDRFFIVFADADDALAAADSAQRALADMRWQRLAEGAQVRLRIGIHSGDALVTIGRYVGPEVQRAARIAAAGHGGQIVVSRAVVDQVTKFGYALPDGTHLRDLGAHWLPGLVRRERLFQLALPELPRLPTTFPPLRTRDVWPEIRADAVSVSALTLVILALVGLLLPLVVPTFPRALGLVAGGVVVALLAVGGVAVALRNRDHIRGFSELSGSHVKTLFRSLAAPWHDARKGAITVVSFLLSAIIILTTLFMTKPPTTLTLGAAGYDYSYTYHRPTRTGGSVVIWTYKPIHTLVSPALYNYALPDNVYRAVWNACLVQLPDLKLPSLEGWKADQCTTVPTVANGDESPDFKTTTFRIDPRAMWSDGQPITADDFLFTFRLIQDPSVVGSMDPCPCNNSLPPWNLMQLRELDPHTLQIDWSQPYFDYLAALADFTPQPLHEYASGPYAGVFNPITSAYNSALARQMATSGSFNLAIPVDNGPFVVRSVEGYPGDYHAGVVSTARQVVLARNPHFFSKFFHAPVALDQVTFETSFAGYPPDPTANGKMIGYYRQGGVTVVDSLGPPDLASLRGIPSGEVVSSPGQGLVFFGFNQRTTALNAQANGGVSIFFDANVRKAFTEAFDRCGALRVVFGLRNCADPNYVTNEHAVPSNPDYDPTVTLPAYNPTDAAKLLDHAGYRVVDGVRRFRDGTTPLQLTVSPAPGTEDYQGFVRRLQQDYLRNLQITVYVQSPVGGDEVFQSLLSGAFDIGIEQESVGPDLSQNLPFLEWDSASIPSQQNLYGQNWYGLIDPWMVTQGQIAVQTPVEAQRNAVYKAMARHVAEQLDVLPVVIVTDITLVKPTLCNYKKSPTGGGYLWNMADWYMVPSCP